jgi:hypothetical protein
MLKSQPPVFVKFIRNICWNLINNKIEISKEDKVKLKKFKTIIRKLGDVRVKRVKKEIALSGGFIPILTPVLISLISQLGGKLFSKAIGV